MSDLEEDDFISIDLNDFSIYRPQQISARPISKISDSNVSERTRSNELVSLHDLCDRGSNCFLFDGTVSYGENGQQQRYVQGVPFEILSIGTYEDVKIHAVGADIWLQSITGKSSKIWYRLKRPAAEYLRYYEPFRWLADLSKHLIDFLYSYDRVTLQGFKSTFATWIDSIHGLNQSFRSWRRQHLDPDFRRVIAAHATFLYNQAGQLGSRYCSHPIWTEIDPAALTAIPRQISKRKDRGTVVTPFVYECFSHMPWAKFLDPVPDRSAEATAARLDSPANPRLRVTSNEGQVETGDVVAIQSDTNTSWQTKDDYWYAYVQGRQTTKNGRQRLNLIWLYRPSDTACQDMRYPYSNELFMSDHCNCGDSAIYAEDVAYKVCVVLLGSPKPTRQTFSCARNTTVPIPTGSRCSLQTFGASVVKSLDHPTRIT